MTIWEKAVVNMQHGAQRVAIAAATFSERVKVEIALVRLRIRIDEVQDRINGMHQAIGRRVEMLHNSDALPKTSEQLLLDEEIAASLNALAERKNELETLKAEIRTELDALKPMTRKTEDPQS